MMKSDGLKRTHTLEIEVTAPATVPEREIVDAINYALDERPGSDVDWAEWTVGAAIIKTVKKHK